MRTDVGVLGSSTATQLSCLAYHGHGRKTCLHRPSSKHLQPLRRFQHLGSWRVTPASKAGAAASRSGSSSSTGSDSELDDAAAFATNIWEPVPPTPTLGRKRKVALLLGCAMLEVTLTGVEASMLSGLCIHNTM
jgi:hypothetical protein